MLDDPRYVVGGGAADNGASLGALLELILIVANIGTAVVLYPVVKRVNEILALGFVAARLVECAFIAVSEPLAEYLIGACPNLSDSLSTRLDA